MKNDIVRKFQWILVISLHLLSTIKAQNARSYDTNEWIPIAPTNEPDSTKKAEGRVLTLDTPNQNFFPDNDYTRKRPQSQQYLREAPYQKGSNNVRQPKVDQPYKFEPVLPLQSPQFIQQPQFIQPQVQQPQYVQPVQQQVPYVQPPTQEQVLSQQLLAPPRGNFYDPSKAQRFEIPINNSFYQSLNPGSINQELVGAIQNNQNIHHIALTTTTTKPKEEKESVQLLYVPLENLKPSLPVTPRIQTVATKPAATAAEEKKLPNLQNHKQFQLDNIENDFVKQALAAHKLQQQLLLGQPLLLQTTTTARPKKRKPHQPPLAVYMEKQGSADVKDVLEVLKHAKSISVQDSVGPNSPQVFVGPSNLKQAEAYVKFPLPYLSNVQGNRIERKVEQLPFFVAPLSYKTPEGYSKIPLPSPHVGSVVVSTKDDLHEKHPEPTRQQQATQNQIVQDFDIKQPFPTYRQEVKPDSYLLGQNNLQQNRNGLLGLENEFLAGLRLNGAQSYETTSPKDFLADYQVNSKGNIGEDYEQTPSKDFVPNTSQNYQQTPSKGFVPNTSQNYQQSPSKDFVPNISQNYQQTPSKDFIPNISQNYRQTPVKDFIPNYQLDSAPQFYQTTPSYQSDGKTNIQNNYQIPNYQPNLKEPPPTQNTKDLIRNYDIPSLPVESKTSFIPNYQLEAKPQINQFSSSVEPSFVTPKTQSNLFAFSEEPIKQTTTEAAPPVPQNQFKLIQNTESPFVVPEYNSRNNNQQDPYRQVINQYEIEQINNQFGEVKYTTEVETIPANVYKLQSDKLEPVFIQNQTPVQQQVLNQQALEQQVFHGTISTRQNADVERPVELQQPGLAPLVYNGGQNPQEQEPSPQINPYLPGLINNLQDQSVRPLLVPNLLVPTTEKISTTSLQPATEEIREIITSTEAPRIETTTHRRSRGRMRANSVRHSTSSPRRTSRRRPTHTRPTTERQVVRTTTEIIPTYEPTKRTINHRQRFRTRGRPLPKDFPATERVAQTTENAFKQPPLEGGFQASSGDPLPQSYYQFDHIIENQQVVTIKPDQISEEKPLKEYHQVYDLPPQTSTEQVPETTSTTSKPVVDIQITHPLQEAAREPVIAAKPREEAQFVSRIQSNIQSGGVIHNNRNDDSTTRASVRLRGRSRSRGRFSSTTVRPITTTTTTTTTTTPKPQEEEEEEEEDFYGFIRSPNFNRPSSLVYTTTQQPIQLYSSSYKESPKTLIQLEDEDVSLDQNPDYESVPVRFVGEIRPKYTTTPTTTTTTTESQEYSTQAPRFRTRARIRVPNRKTTAQPAYNEVNSQKLDDQVTRRSSNVIRSRSRGKSHFKLPENLTPKPDDHDVEGGNYPSAYTKGKELTTEKPSGFQITIDPYEEEADGDQEPHYSLYSPTVLKNTDTEWVEASILPSPNDLQIDDKQMYVDSSEEQATLKSEEDEITTTTAKTGEITKRRKGGRKRGVWKLVKQRPVDPFETAESQNYYSILNNFDEIGKEKPSTTTTTTTTEGSILDAIYNIFGLASKGSAYEHPSQVNKTTILPRHEEITTTTVPPTFPEEYTEETITQEIQQDDENQEESTITPQTTTTTENFIKNYDVEPWDMKEIKTSTSTEVSHETEICYKGKCVKSKEDDTSS
ncbi:mucin-4 [Asbolus verrucosus]|uniref:Mucin-4 n=1 Tax=Asbolus verrucosus TaxID=1661398 RepID=A0A482WDZ3_ASBVE|nr:mucin-4 [Asbolus verrucosus]